MRRSLGLLVAGALWLVPASIAQAQVSVSVGVPYSNYAYGAPYESAVMPYNYGAPTLVPSAPYYPAGNSVSTYSSGYYGTSPPTSAYVAPYSSGYYGTYGGASTYVAPYSSGYYGAYPVISTYVAPTYVVPRYPVFGYRRGLLGGVGSALLGGWGFW